MLVDIRGLRRARWPSGGTWSTASAAGLRQRAQSEASLRWRENRDRGSVAAVWRRLKRITIDRLDRLNAPVVYPWSPSNKGQSAADRLHRSASELLSARARTLPERLWLWTKAVVWPVLATGVAVPVWWRCSRLVRDQFGQPRREQWRDLLEAAWRHGIFPTEYYSGRVFSGAAREDKSKYLNEREIIALLAEADQGVDALRVDDLRRLYSECLTAGIPVPHSVATFRDGEVEFLVNAELGALPEKDLFLRPLKWQSDASAQCWRWNPQARGWSHHGETLSGERLIGRTRRASKRAPLILQECLHNHPEVARFADVGLTTIRVATGTNEFDEPQLLFAAFRMPGAEMGGAAPAAVDLTAGIDPDTGHLMPAVGEFVVDGEFDSHPGTGSCITGAAVPHWRAIRELALKAHHTFAEVPFVGWEIALTGSGPVILEATTNWGRFTHVLPAETAFSELCLARLDIVRKKALGVHPLAVPHRSRPPDSAGPEGAPAVLPLRHQPPA